MVKGPLGCKLLVAGLGQSARVRVVEYQQVKSPGRINPLDFLGTSLQAIGCFGKPHGSELYAKGKGLDPNGEAFLRPPGKGAPRLCQQRGRDTWIPCSILCHGAPVP